MTRGQRRLVAAWAAVIAVFVAIMVFEPYILANWDLLANSKWLSWGFLFVSVVIAIRMPTNIHRDTSADLNRIVVQNPWIKVWLVIYSFGVLALLLMALNFDLHLGQLGAKYVLPAVIGLFAPIAIVKQLERFKDLSRAPN